MRARTLAKRAAAIALVAFVAATAPAAQASVVYSASLGPEVPGATGTGAVTLTYDPVTYALRIVASWSGLSGPTTFAHIHCCTVSPFTGTVGVAVTPGTLPLFPVGVTSGTYDQIIDLDNQASFTASFLNNFGGGTLDGARDALFDGLADGRAYFNIHTSAFPGGEIRGFPQRVPEPGTLVLVGLALAGLAASRRRKS